MPQEVTIKITSASYGADDYDGLKDKDGTELLEGFDYGDIETGKEYQPKIVYLRHDGVEPVYGVGLFMRPVGLEWGGFVNAPDSRIPYNPHYFRLGGLDENELPQRSTADYEFFRLQGRDNPEMGMRLHLNRNDLTLRTNGLGHQNVGLSFSTITLPLTAMDYSRPSSNAPTPGRIYPDPIDLDDRGKVGDEAKVGVSFKLSEDVVGGGFAQVSLAVAYRFTY